MWLKLFNHLDATACYRVRIALQIKGLAYDDISVDIFHEQEQFSPAYQKI